MLVQLWWVGMVFMAVAGAVLLALRLWQRRGKR